MLSKHCITVQEVSDRRAAWTEIMAMKCLTSHEHIIEYYDHFLVGRRLGWEPDPKEDTTVVKRFARSGRSESPPRQAAKQKKPDPVLPPYRVKTAYSTLWIVMEVSHFNSLAFPTIFLSHPPTCGLWI